MTGSLLWLPEDASRGCYAVLDGISSAYPPVAGRLHTCYSPVRRSPADESKLSSPLPLDLHVLSLSLAFILSQDQTLRCCLSLFLFFFFKKNRKGQIIEICSVLSVSGKSPRTDSLSFRFIAVAGCRIDKRASLLFVHFFWLLYYFLSIVIVSMFAVRLSVSSFPKASAKIRQHFHSTKCSQTIFSPIFRSFLLFPLSVKQLKICYKT